MRWLEVGSSAPGEAGGPLYHYHSVTPGPPDISAGPILLCFSEAFMKYCEEAVLLASPLFTNTSLFASP